MLRRTGLSLYSRLRKQARRAGRFLRLAVSELDSKAPIPFRDRLRMVLSGFLSESFVLYELDKNDPSKYLTDFQRDVRTPDLNNGYSVLLRDKVIFSLITGRFPAHNVRTFGIVREGHIVYGVDARTNDAVRYLLDLLQTHPRLVIKPVVGGGGRSIRFLSREGEQLSCNGAALTEAHLRDLVDGMKNDIITGFVEQHPEIAALYPRTVNTLRLLTMWDVDACEPFVAGAAMRIGRDSSYPVDNWTKGGLSAAVDPETGQLGKGVSFPGTSRTLTWHSQHPESGVQIEGFTLPAWQSLKARMLEICRSVPYLEYVGWDIILTIDGFKILEGNPYSGVRLLQIHRPLLADQRVAKFYKARRIL